MKPEALKKQLGGFLKSIVNCQLFNIRAGAKGVLTIQVLIFGSVSVILLTGFVLWMDINLRAARRDYDEIRAFAIAEAGIEYYRWHLAHAPNDFEDGTASSGPYTHAYFDRNNNHIGNFSLVITPPVVGSTVVTIKSTGTLVANPTVEKIIQVRLGIPSFAKYAAVLEAAVRFGAGTEVFGEIHSNNGIRFDGLAHNLVSSAIGTYDDPDHSGANEYAVHTHIPTIDVLPTSTLEAHADVFEVGRLMSVPPVNFTGITQDLSEMQGIASSSGFYRASSTAFGYEVVFRPDDTFTLYRVNSTTTPPANCTNSQGQSGWGTWSIAATTSLGAFPMPTSGIIFLEDNVWVRGQINTARVTVAAARFPDNPLTRASVTFQNPLTYTNYNGSDTIGIIAQNNINIGMISSSSIRIDAALIAQNGRIGRYYYRPPGGGQNRCSPWHARSDITSYGMIGSSQRYGFAYTDGTGYTTRSLIYDANLLYGPPPSFPLTSDAYTLISWDELK